MKTEVLTILCAICLVGCGKPDNDSAHKETTDTTSPLTAPGDYLGALNKGKIAAEKTIDTSSLNKAIQMFSIENGRNPKSLDELVEEKFMPALPKAPYGMQLQYDATSGKVSVVAKPK